jgi:hypothetical protein
VEFVNARAVVDLFPVIDGSADGSAKIPEWGVRVSVDPVPQFELDHIEWLSDSSE